MPATEFQGSSSPSFTTAAARSIFASRRDQMENPHDSTAQEHEAEAFQGQVTQMFHELSSANSDELLSVDWIRNLLDVFLLCQEEFRALLFGKEAYLNKPPMDKLVSDYFERSVKALDVCNAIRDGIEQIRQWQKQAEIVLCALDCPRGVGEGQIRRARKALIDLAIGMLDEKDKGNASVAHRNRSFGRSPKDHHKSLAHFRSLSWSVSRSWSASKQLQAIGNNLVAPKTNEIVATNGLSAAVYTMSYVLYFVMWALVAAIPCQDRGLQTHFSIPRQFVWGIPILSLHERIFEDSKKKDRRNACGLLKEIHQLEICARQISELADSVQFPLSDEKEGEVREKAKELATLHGAIKDGLEPLEKRVREVFLRIVRSRTEGLDSMVKATE